VLGESGIKKIADRILACSQADQTEVVITVQDSQLTRFANSAIHQNVAERNTQVNVRAVVGKRIGVASTNDLSTEALQRVAETAVAIARLQPENPDFISLPGPTAITPVDAFDGATAAFTPQARARAVDIICRQAMAEGLVAAGAFERLITGLGGAGDDAFDAAANGMVAGYPFGGVLDHVFRGGDDIDHALVMRVDAFFKRITGFPSQGNTALGQHQAGQYGEKRSRFHVGFL